MGQRTRYGIVLVVAALLSASCGGSDGATKVTVPTPTSAVPETPSNASTTPESTSTTAAPSGGLDGEDAFVRTIVGSTYGDAARAGATAHQRSDFGTKGSWTLFTVEHDDHWYAFTTKNVAGVDGVGTLGDRSTIATGERLRDLPDDHWYGVEGIVRDGREIGGVMLEGRGYDREGDGTFPAVDAWRVNLQSLRLEHTSIAGLDVVEPCG